MNAISQLEEWSRTGNGACLDYMPAKRVLGTPDHAPKWTVALGIVVDDTLEPFEFQGKPCTRAKESKKDAAAQAVKALTLGLGQAEAPKESAKGPLEPQHGPMLRIEPTALFVAHNSRIVDDNKKM
jgi:hypothetical protein